MFDNIGSKIKKLAQIVCWIGIVLSIIIGLGIIEKGSTSTGLLIAALGSLFSWIGSFTTYGLGQLIENTDLLVASTTRTNRTLEKPIFTDDKSEENKSKGSADVKHKWRCSGCGNMISENVCPFCKTKSGAQTKDS